METIEFSRLAYKSACHYLENLRESKSGTEVIYVTEIIDIGNLQFKLITNKKAIRLDCAKVNINSPLIPIDAKDIVKIIGYNEKEPSVTIRALPDVYQAIKKLSPDCITIESDLTFLVEAVKKWYHKYHDNIREPMEDGLFPTLDFPKESKLSERQKEAIETALSSKMSYIWGAPGTGKTRFVLANCILEHIKNNQTVLLMAPTNNALEQSIRGILQVFREQNIPTNKLIRLGQASSDFSLAFPETCETRALDKKIEERSNELAELIKKNDLQQEYFSFTEKYNLFKPLVQQYYAVQQICSSLQEKLTLYEKQKEEISTTLASYNKALDCCNKELYSLTQEKSSFKHKIKAFFKQEAGADLDQRITAKIEQIEALKRSIEAQTQPLNQIQSTITGVTAELDKNKSQINTYYASIQKIIVDVFAMQQSIEVASVLFEEKSKDFIDLSIDPDLQSSIQQKQEELENLQLCEENQFRERNIIACTVDYAILRYEKFAKGLADYAVHLYVDEAAYCPMIKAGVFFAFGIPVTFLGDHMQLPPICEVEEKTIINSKHDIFLWAQSALHFPDVFLKTTDFDILFQAYAEHQNPTFENVNTVFLNETFRFGNNLASILDRFVYHSGFTGIDQQTIIKVIDVPRSSDEKVLFASEGEAQAIADYVMQNRSSLQDYAILTPYKKQIYNISRRLRTKRDNIFTIHASQGREWDTVIISVVDCHRKFFMNSKNQESNGLKIINTAISRAKKEIILVLDYESWRYAQDEQLIGTLAANHTEILN